MRAAIYARVSTVDQEPENQLQELRRYVRARSWSAAEEYVDHGVYGLSQGDKGHSERFQLAQGQDQVTQGSGEAIQLPD